ncbi:MAG: hypothetical protein J5884_01595 [Paludibacteraceae bacterium]|nr:hypothetical protein [Paludibacteraceae bacterium]
MTKKFFMFAAMLMAVAAVTFTSCKKNEPVDQNQARITLIKAEALQGPWQGHTFSLVGEGDLATITFTETKITAVFEDETVTVNILKWNCIDAKDVWLDLDRDNTHLTIHDIIDGKMTTGIDSTFGLNVFPSELTRVK